MYESIHITVYSDSETVSNEYERRRAALMRAAAELAELDEIKAVQVQSDGEVTTYRKDS